MNYELLCVNKTIKQEGLTLSEVMNIFNKSDDLEKIKDAVKQAKDRLFVTFASVDVRDKEAESIPIDDMLAKQSILMERGGPITDMHSNKVVGRTLAYKQMKHPSADARGILHLNKIFNHYSKDDQVWSEIKSGERSGSSVGGENKDTRMIVRDGMLTKELIGFDHMETASVYSPANQLSLNQAVSAVAKSDTKKTEIFIKSNNQMFKLLPINKNNVLKPKELDEIVQAILDNPDFKPLPGRTREESAHAIAQAQLNKIHDPKENKQYSDDEEEDKNARGGKMSDKTKGDINDVAMQKMAAGEQLNKDEHAAISSLLNKVAPEDEEEKPDEEDEEKVDEEEEEVIPPDPEEEEEEEEKEKADASSEMPGGAAGDDEPEAPKPDEENDLDALKTELKNLKKQVSDMKKVKKNVKKVSTRRPQGVVNQPKANPAYDVLKGESKPKKLNEMWAAANAEYRKRVGVPK